MNQKSLVKGKMQVSKMFLTKKGWLPFTLLLQLEDGFRQGERTVFAEQFLSEGSIVRMLQKGGRVVVSHMSFLRELRAPCWLGSCSLLTSEH